MDFRTFHNFHNFHSFHSFRAPNSGPLTLDGTNTYRLGDVVIDPGPDDERHLRTVAKSGETREILLTHRHPDHASGAKRLSEMTGAEVLAFGSGLEDGDEVSGLVAVHTPGHAPDHLCFWEPESRTLLSGDLIAGRGSIMVSPPEGDLADYMDSLARVRDLGPARLLPGHGPEVPDAKAKVEEYISHREEREMRVIEALEAGAKTLDEVVGSAYDDTPAEMRPYAESAVRAHLIKLEKTLPEA